MMDEESLSNVAPETASAQNPLKRNHDETVDGSDAAAPPLAKKAHLDETVEPASVLSTASASAPAPAVDMDEEELAMQMMNEGVDPLASAGPSKQQDKQKGPGSADTKKQDSRPQRKGKGRENYKGRDTGFVGDGTVAEKVRGEDGEEVTEKEVKYPKRKVALFVGYSGTGYSGMQFQTRPDTGTWSEITIEGLIFEALTKLSLISAANSTDPKKIDLQRAARTDKGVSAAGNVVSMKMITEFPGLEEKEVLIREVNKLLPDDVRLWGFVRTLSGFNARTACDTRVYEYLFPSYMLLPPKPGCKLDVEIKEFAAKRSAEQAASGSGSGSGSDEAKPELDTEAVHPFWAAIEASSAGKDGLADETSEVEGKNEEVDVSPVVVEETDKVEGDETKPSSATGPQTKTKTKSQTYLTQKRQWRVGTEELNRFKEMCAMFVGSHNFHNFTLFKPFNDKTVKRFILSIDAAEPQVYSGMEWVSVKIHGQSFMLHQIRKMMALAMMAARTKTPPSVIPAMFGRPEIHIPKAPALGLLLENPRFGSFNKKAARLAEQNKQAQGTEPISFEPYREEIEAFKVKNIYEKMREEEDKAAIYHTWVSTIDTRGGDALSYLNPHGIIPERAIKATKPKGQSRAKMESKDVAGSEAGADAEAEEGVESDDEADEARRGVKADDEE